MALKPLIACVALLAAYGEAASAAADLAVELRVGDPTPVVGTVANLTVIAYNAGPNRARNTVVTVLLPDGLDYLSDSGGGDFDPSSGQWNIGRLSGATGEALMIAATVAAAGELTIDAEIRSTSSDGNPDNNDYSLTLEARRAPNVVVIMLDDLDERSLQDMLDIGGLPAIQSEIVDRSVRFTESFATNPTCCPSRATFLTGQYSHNNGVLANMMPYAGFGMLGGVGKLNDEDTLATRLSEIGYATGFIGKYLNGYGSAAHNAGASPAFDPTYVPPGWSHWQGLVDIWSFCMYDYRINDNGTVVRYELEPGQIESSELYQTNVLAALAADFIVAKRSGPKPFFLTVMPFAPHVEVCAGAYAGSPPQSQFDAKIRPAPEDRFAAVPPFVPSPAYDEDTSDKPVWLAGLEPLSQQNRDAIVAQYEQRLRSLVAVDRLVASVAVALGPAIDDTVIVFTSDNGWLYGERRFTGKRYAYDESARVPLYIRLPETASPDTRSELVINTDLAPTILSMADPDFAADDFDGRSILPLVQSADPVGWEQRQRFLIVNWRRAPGVDALYPTSFAVRSPLSLYIESTDDTVALSPGSDLLGLERYNLLLDPFQLESNLHFPGDQPDPVQQSWIEDLRNCAGPTCRDAENAD